MCGGEGLHLFPQLNLFAHPAEVGSTRPGCEGGFEDSLAEALESLRGSQVWGRVEEKLVAPSSIVPMQLIADLYACLSCLQGNEA